MQDDLNVVVLGQILGIAHWSSSEMIPSGMVLA